jgi:hypothetical protein
LPKSNPSTEVVSIRAGGVLWAIEIETDETKLDWLDEAILRVCVERQRVDDLLRAFEPLPAPLLEDGLADMLKRNLLLLDVGDGTVVASGLTALKHRHDPERTETFLAWQDHASGLIVPWHQVASWSTRDFSGEELPLRTIQRHRVPSEMSDAELLHALDPYRSDARNNDIVRRKERVGLKDLLVRAARHEDGRYALMDGVPRLLRARWARLPDQSLVGEGEVWFPPTWQEAIGRWVDSVEKLVNLATSAVDRSALKCVRETMLARPTIRMSTGFQTAAEQAVRKAEIFVAVAASWRRNSVGNAIGLLSNAAPGVHRLLLAEEDARLNRHRTRLVDGRIAHVPLPIKLEGGLDLLICDGTSIIFGGMSHPAMPVFEVVSAAPLSGVLAWLGSLGVDRSRLGPETISAESPAAAGSIALVRDVELVSDAAKVVAQGLKRGKRDNATVDREPVDALVAQVRIVEARLRERTLSPLTWVAPAELPALVHSAPPPARAIVGEDCATLAAAFIEVGGEVVRWPQGRGAAEVIVAGDYVALGQWCASGGPDFVVVREPELASRLRHESDLFERVS